MNILPHPMSAALFSVEIMISGSLPADRATKKELAPALCKAFDVIYKTIKIYIFVPFFLPPSIRSTNASYKD